MNAATMLRHARQRSGLSLRELAARAGTSYSTLSAYENGAKTPRVDTLTRILDASGCSVFSSLEVHVMQRGGFDRGEELEAVLDLAEQFPARHRRTLDAPRFGYRL